MMAAAGVEEDPAVQAARILLTLRSRRLLRWPEWVDKEEPPVAAAAAAVVEVRWPLEGWPKRQRSARRCPSGWRPGMVPPELGLVAASSGSGASSSGESRERSPAPPRWKERPHRARDEPARRPDSAAAYYVKPAGSGPSTTSADRKARPRHAVVDKASAVAKAKASAAAASAAATKEPMMKASSPETPLDFGADAAGSGASSSGDDAARLPSKRRAPGSGGGGGASSGDEGCTSQDKRARVDAGGDGGARGEKAISEPKVQAPDDSDKGVKFAFDLNMPCPEDDF